MVCCLDSPPFSCIQLFKFCEKLVAIAGILRIEVQFVPILPLVVCLRLSQLKV